MMIARILSWVTVPLLFTTVHGGLAEPRVAQVRPKDMNRTGERYYEDWQPFEVRTVNGLEDYNPRDIPIGRYGDRTDMQFKVTGFYYTKQVDGKWWIISPDGHPLIHIAMNSVNLRVSDPIKENFEEKYSSPEAWADDAVSLLRRYGYNGAGCWADVDQIRAYNKRHNTHFSYVYHLSMVADYRAALDRSRGYHEGGQELFPVFDEAFEAYCAYRAGKLAAYRDDPNLFGYSFDNELTWSRDLLDAYLTLPEKDSGHRAAIGWLKARGLGPKDSFTDAIRDQFRAFVMDRYFRVISEAIREVDANHMLLGSRFYWNDRIYFDDNQSGMLTNPLVFQTAGKYVDILQCNYYFRWTPVPEEIDSWTKWSGRPFMITEGYVKGDDTGMNNRRGAGGGRTADDARTATNGGSEDRSECPECSQPGLSGSRPPQRFRYQ